MQGTREVFYPLSFIHLFIQHSAFYVGAVEVEVVRRAAMALACQVQSRYLLISIDLLCLTLAGDLFAILIQANVPGSIS